jgi:hypothetical protein
MDQMKAALILLDGVEHHISQDSRINKVTREAAQRGRQLSLSSIAVLRLLAHVAAHRCLMPR